MKKKYKLTGFSRLLVFMIFFAPLAYLGASYIQGEDGVAKLKSILNKETSTTIQSQIDSKNTELKKLEKKIEILKRDIKRLEASK